MNNTYNIYFACSVSILRKGAYTQYILTQLSQLLRTLCKIPSTFWLQFFPNPVILNYGLHTIPFEPYFSPFYALFFYPILLIFSIVTIQKSKNVLLAHLNVCNPIEIVSIAVDKIVVVLELMASGMPVYIKSNFFVREFFKSILTSHLKCTVTKILTEKQENSAGNRFIRAFGYPKKNKA